jgi:hypothetical protein
VKSIKPSPKTYHYELMLQVPCAVQVRQCSNGRCNVIFLVCPIGVMTVYGSTRCVSAAKERIVRQLHLDF